MSFVSGVWEDDVQGIKDGTEETKGGLIARGNPRYLGVVLLAR